MFCNPPYGRQIGDWVQKGYEESQKPGTLVVMLIPSRTDTSYFHDYILHGKADEIRFLRGRLKFTDEDGNAKDAAPFPSAVVVWRSPDMAQSVKDMVLELIRGESMTANEIAAVLAGRGVKVSRSDVGSGRSMPCDTRPVNYRIKPGGSTKLVTPAGDVISCETVDDPAEAQGWGYTPHWSTCNAPDSFGKGGRK